MKKKLTGVALVLAAVSLMGIKQAWSLVARWTGKKTLCQISMCFHVECSVRDTIKKKQ